MHPQLSALTSEQDRDMLGYMTDLQVSSQALRGAGCVVRAWGHAVGRATGKISERQASLWPLPPPPPLLSSQVEEVLHPSSYCKITLLFRNNPYFWNKMVVKEYRVSTAGNGCLPGRGPGRSQWSWSHAAGQLCLTTQPCPHRIQSILFHSSSLALGF